MKVRVGLLFWCVLTLTCGVTQGVNVVEKLRQLEATTLVDYIDLAGLTDILTGIGPFTIIAPTNEAFDSLPEIFRFLLENYPSFMAEVLMSHVVFGALPSQQFTNDLIMTTVQGTKIRINVYDEGVADFAVCVGQILTATGGQLTLLDAQASNGIIHLVDSVLYPWPSINMMEAVDADLEHVFLSTFLALTELDKELSGRGPYTLFAPNDDAFSALPGDILEDLIQNPAKLSDILKYHIVPSTFFSIGLPGNKTLSTAGGSTISVTRQQGELLVNDARTTYLDYTCTNGVIHGIDTVLVPPSL